MLLWSRLRRNLLHRPRSVAPRSFLRALPYPLFSEPVASRALRAVRRRQEDHPRKCLRNHWVSFAGQGREHELTQLSVLRSTSRSGSCPRTTFLRRRRDTKRNTIHCGLSRGPKNRWPTLHPALPIGRSATPPAHIGIGRGRSRVSWPCFEASSRTRRRPALSPLSVLRGRSSIGSRTVSVQRFPRNSGELIVVVDPVRGALAGYIIEQCIQPRCLLSPMDADFCVQFIKAMHSHGTPGFSTLQCYDKVCVLYSTKTLVLTTSSA